jgi:hypothetical protein
MFNSFLFLSDVLVISFGGGFIDSFGQSVDVRVQLIDFSGQFGIFGG